MTPAAKHTGPKRGEIGLAKFHRLIGVASFLSGLALMLASLTALYWFGGVIGMPPLARVAVSIAIEVMAASLASSATTARRAGGGVDWSAWVGFVFFVSIAAYANIMHVIVFIDTSLAPSWLSNTEFTFAACVFAAACPFGGTWGVHRFGWLRANGADADWTDTADGIVVTTPPPAKTKPAKALKGEQTTDTKQDTPPETVKDKPPVLPKPEPVPTAAKTGDEPDWKATVREVFTAEMAAAEDPDAKPEWKAIWIKSGVDVVQPTVRKFCREVLWPEYETARADQPQPEAADPDDEQQPVDLRAEIHVADPAEEPDGEAPVVDRRVVGVA